MEVVQAYFLFQFLFTGLLCVRHTGDTEIEDTVLALKE